MTKRTTKQADAAAEATATETTATEATTTGTEIATLPPAERAAIVLDATKAEEQLRAMVTETADITEVKDKDSRTLVHNAAMKLKNARVAIEKTGKAARDDANAFSKAVIAEENRLKAIITTEEDRLFKLRDDYDQQIEAEKQERENREKARVAAITSRITAIKALPLDSANDTAEQLQQTLQELTGFEIGDDFAEFKAEAEAAKAGAVTALQVLHQAAANREAETARLKAEADRLAAERAELEQMRAQLQAQLAAQQPAPTAEPEAVEQAQQAEEPAGEDNAQEETQPEPFETQHDMFAQASDEPAEAEQMDANAFVMELAKHTAMQFEAMAEKVGIVAAAVRVDELRKGFNDFALQLRNVATNLDAGHFDDALLNADWSAMGNADKAIALASHAGVALIFGNEAMGASVLREAAE
ncbi:MAG TPA: hypothetical protein VFW49_15030 [Fluviicoccus sp.]|nr:hypothetical protein [Fluviicoccus sp.]